MSLSPISNSTSQLQNLLDDDIEFQDFFETLDSIKGPVTVRDSLYDELADLARTFLVSTQLRFLNLLTVSSFREQC